MRNNRKAVSVLMGMVMSAVTVFGGQVISSEASAEQKFPQKPVYDAQTDTTDWDYVYFGSYPQTELTGVAVTEAIENASYDTYGDAEVEGQKYRRVRAGGGSYMSSLVDEGFYDWSDKDYAYFKYEPIKWRVLDNDGESLFLMADSVLDCRKYCQNDGNVTWATSNARNWLNGYEAYAEGTTSFMNMAFTAEEQADIVTTTVQDSENLLHKTKGGESTTDKIFFLSIREVLNENYGFSSDFMLYSQTRRLEPTDYAHAMGVWMSTYNEEFGDYCWWLLRSPGSHTKAVSMVYRFGNVYQDGYYADTPYYGACPALKVDIDSDAWTLAEDSETAQEEAVITICSQAGELEGDVTVTEKNAAASGSMAGDADGDKEISLKDAQMVLKTALKITNNADSLKHCDVDGEGTIGLKDAQLILKYALKIIKEFPANPQVEASEAPVTSNVPDVSTNPAVSTQPEEPPAASTKPTASTRPTPPPISGSGVIPQVSQGPLVQEKHDASGTMWIAADSIAVSYNSKEAMGLCGWGEVIGEYFNSDVTVQNMAIGGRSSKSFTQESKYKTIMSDMQAGDYLFISFGHNDERAALELYTDPYGDSSTFRSYKWYLKECYIDPAIRKGVQPVLVSPVARRYFYEGDFINPQLHTPYAQAMEELVQEYANMGMTVYYIDLHDKMLNLYEELGEDGTYSLHANNDTTHLCRAGIDIVCDYMVDEMKKQNMNIISFLK